MKRLSAGWWLGLSSLLAVGGTTWAFPSWPSDTGLDLWNLPQLRASMDELAERSSTLEQKSGEVYHRVMFREEVITDLVEGRINLREAAEMFGELNEESPPPQAVVQRYFAGRDQNESLARQVLHFVAIRIRENPSLAEKINGRLQAELQEIIDAQPASPEPRRNESPINVLG